MSFLVLASGIQKLDRITWQDDVAIESVRLEIWFAAYVDIPGA